MSQKHLRKSRRFVEPREIAIAVVIGAAVFAVALPFLKHARESSGRQPCPGNLNRIGMAIYMYSSEHGGQFPTTLRSLFGPGGLDATTFVCPSDPLSQKRLNALKSAEPASGTGEEFSYVYLGAGLTVRARHDVVVAYDRPENHAPDGSNVLTADGTTCWMTREKMARILAEVASGHRPVRIDPSSDAVEPELPSSRP